MGKSRDFCQEKEREDQSGPHQDKRTDSAQRKAGGGEFFFWPDAVCHRALPDSGVSSFGFYSSVKEFVIPFFLTETFAGSIMKRILKKVCRKKRRYEKEGDVQSRKNYDGFADSGRPDFYGLW